MHACISLMEVCGMQACIHHCVTLMCRHGCMSLTLRCLRRVYLRCLRRAASDACLELPQAPAMSCLRSVPNTRELIVWPKTAAKDCCQRLVRKTGALAAVRTSMHVCRAGSMQRCAGGGVLHASCMSCYLHVLPPCCIHAYKHRSI